MCAKCGGTGIISTWCGRRDEGGRTGPCPECRTLATKQFLQQLSIEHLQMGQSVAPVRRTIEGS